MTEVDQGRMIDDQLTTILKAADDPHTVRMAQTVLAALRDEPSLCATAASLYVHLVRAEKANDAEFVLTHLLPDGATETASLWPWRLFHLAQMGDEAGINLHFARQPINATIPIAWWHRVVLLCERHQIACGANLRRLLRLDLPDTLSVPAVLAADIILPKGYGQQAIEKIVGMRNAMGISSPPAFLKDRQKAQILDSLLLTYALDAKGPNVFGRDCLLASVDFHQNPDWTACLVAGRPFVLAGFHAGPLIDGSWPTRTARIPLFHFAHLNGSRSSPNVIATESISPADFARASRAILRAPAGVIISPDLGRGLRDTGQKVGDQPILLLPFAAFIAHRMNAEVFFSRTRWQDGAIGVEIFTGPRANASQPRDTWEATCNAAYAQQIASIVAGKGLDNLRY